MKNQTEIKDVSVDTLLEKVGGVSNEPNDFVILNKMKFNDSYLRHPIRAEASAVVLCLRGEVKLSVGMEEYELKANSVMMYGQKNLIEIKEYSEDFLQSIVVFTSDFIKETMLDMKSVIPIFQYVNESGTGMLSLDEEEVAVLSDFYELLNRTMAFNKSAITQDLMTAFIRSLAVMYSRRVMDAQIVRTRHEEYLDRFMHAVQQHHKKHRSVKFYADELHITPKYLSSVIKEVSGRSATDWIDDFVIREAKTLLRFSSKSIQEITYTLNFSTQSFFGKYFKRHTGVSPSEYRLSK